MRSPVARRGAALGLVISTMFTLLIMGAQVASAAGSAAVESRASGSLSGPVGLAAVLLGAGGLVVGLIRRRKSVVISAENQRIAPPAEEQPATTQA